MNVFSVCSDKKEDQEQPLETTTHDAAWSDLSAAFTAKACGAGV